YRTAAPLDSGKFRIARRKKKNVYRVPGLLSHVVVGVGEGEGGELHAGVVDVADAGVGGDVDLVAEGVGDLGDEEEVGEGRGGAVGEGAGVGEKGFQGLEAFLDPVRVPAVAARFVDLQLAREVAQDAEIVQRVDFARH